MTRDEFDMAFQIITEGDNAKISDELQRKLGEHWGSQAASLSG